MFNNTLAPFVSLVAYGRKTMSNKEKMFPVSSAFAAVILLIVLALIAAYTPVTFGQEDWVATDWDQPVRQVIAVEYTGPILWDIRGTYGEEGLVAVEGAPHFQILIWELDETGMIKAGYVLDGTGLTFSPNCEAMMYKADESWAYWDFDLQIDIPLDYWTHASYSPEETKIRWDRIWQSRFYTPDWIENTSVWEPRFLDIEFPYSYPSGETQVLQNENAKAYTCEM